MNTHFWQRAVSLVVLTTFLTTGCASLQPAAPAAVQVGENVRVPYAEIASLDVRREGEHKMKPGVVIAIVAAVGALALALGGGGGGGSGY